MSRAKWLSPVREAHDPLMGISGVKPWPGLTVNQRYPLLSPPYNLTDHIPQIAGSACGPGVVFMVNGRSTFSFHSLSCSLTEFEREKYATKRAGMGVRWDRSNSLGRTRNSVVTAVTSHFGATASHYHKQESPVTPSAQISDVQKKARILVPQKKSKACI